MGNLKSPFYIIFLGILNSLAPGRFEYDPKNVIFNLVLLIGIFKSSYDNVLRWMPQDLTDDRSTLVQVMAWCRQATSHYMNQCWPRSQMPYGVTRPQWVKKYFLHNFWGIFNIDQVTGMRLSCHLVLLSTDSKTSEQDTRTFIIWPISIYQCRWYRGRWRYGALIKKNGMVRS